MQDVFVASQAVTAGLLTRHELQRWHRPIFRGVYVPKGHELSLGDRTAGALLACRRSAVVGGIAASALHGAKWIDVDTPVELVAPMYGPNAGCSRATKGWLRTKSPNSQAFPSRRRLARRLTSAAICNAMMRWRGWMR